MPLLVFVYFTQFLDKNILSYASIMDFPVTGIWYNDVAQAFCGYTITLCMNLFGEGFAYMPLSKVIVP